MDQWQGNLEEQGNTVVRRYQALLDMADLLVHHGSVPDLMHALAERLRSVVSFDFINFALHDAERSLMRLDLWEGGESPSLPMALEINDSPSGWAWQHQQPLVFDDITDETGFGTVFEILRARGVHSYCVLPLSTGETKLGGLGFGSREVGAYRTSDLELLKRVAELVSIAIEDSIIREQLRVERERLQGLLEVNSSLIRPKELTELIAAISASMYRVLGYNYGTLDLVSSEDEDEIISYPLGDFPLTRRIINVETSMRRQEVPSKLAIESGQVKVFTRAELQNMQGPLAKPLLEQGLQWLSCIPLLTSERVLGSLNVGSTTPFDLISASLDILRQLGAPVASALENARAYREIAQLKDKLAKEKIYLEDEIRTELNFEEIIGESANLKAILDQVRTVAPSDANVLILGETGTGKELVARAIHKMSARQGSSFIKVNCAAIPSGLLESELFGHERGAFTGAITQKIGRMELADKGTLFLDEVGDIPLELQPKLLRALQDQEFERLGSTRTMKVDARIIAATNKNLAQSVADREFRSDLFYRLSVFPVTLPPLRERRKDIPLLVRYFVQRFARRMNKPIDTIAAETMSVLSSWDWPGNVRELENFIERSVILTKGSTLAVPVGELKPAYEASTRRRDTSLENAEREHILRILRETAGVIAGTRGAAARLGLKRTTLQSKMQKLGISRRDYEN
jgi:formate hydrogenlyase transcriptional activator